MNLRSFTPTVTLATLLTFGSGAMLAQQMGSPGGVQPSAPTAPTAAGQPGMPGQPGSPEQPGTPGSQPSANNYADSSFVRAALQNDQSQVALSQLAAQKSSSPDIQQFSQQMVKVHTALDGQLKPLAKQFDIKDPQKPSKKDKHELSTLQALSGSNFDTAYLQAIAEEQQHSLKVFTDEGKSAQNPGLQKAANSDEATLEQNYQVLQKLGAQHNVTLDAKK